MVFVNEALTKDANAFDRVWIITPMNPHLETKFIEPDIKNTDRLVEATPDRQRNRLKIEKTLRLCIN